MTFTFTSLHFLTKIYTFTPLHFQEVKVLLVLLLSYFDSRSEKKKAFFFSMWPSVNHSSKPGHASLQPLRDSSGFVIWVFHQSRWAGYRSLAAAVFKTTFLHNSLHQYPKSCYSPVAPNLNLTIEQDSVPKYSIFQAAAVCQHDTHTRPPLKMPLKMAPLALRCTRSSTHSFNCTTAPPAVPDGDCLKLSNWKEPPVLPCQTTMVCCT